MYGSSYFDVLYTIVLCTCQYLSKNLGSYNRLYQGCVWFTLCMFSPIWGEGNGRSISGFAVNRGFTVHCSFTERIEWIALALAVAVNLV